MIAVGASTVKLAEINPVVTRNYLDSLTSLGAANCLDAIHCHGVFSAPWRMRDALQCLRTQTEQWTWRMCSDDYASINPLIYSVISEARCTSRLLRSQDDNEKQLHNTPAILSSLCRTTSTHLQSGPFYRSKLE